MEYGKVKVTGDNMKGYTVRIGAGSGEAYERRFCIRAHAYNEAGHLRSMFKRGLPPGAIVQNLGYIVVAV